MRLQGKTAIVTGGARGMLGDRPPRCGMPESLLNIQLIFGHTHCFDPAVRANIQRAKRARSARLHYAPSTLCPRKCGGFVIAESHARTCIFTVEASREHRVAKNLRASTCFDGRYRRGYHTTTIVPDNLLCDGQTRGFVY
jgi:hypothetical protein